jgi:REP element-mobilizing transposase RayT
MTLNAYGKIVADTARWFNLQYGYVQLDEWGVMPNHFHVIIMINRTGDYKGGLQTNDGVPDCRGGSRTAPTNQKIKPLGRLVGAFKTVSTKHINEVRRTTGAILWQRNYYEHIIRDDDDLNRIREYIINNPAKWAEDEDNPLNIKKPTKTQS